MFHIRIGSVGRNIQTMARKAFVCEVDIFKRKPSMNGVGAGKVDLSELGCLIFSVRKEIQEGEVRQERALEKFPRQVPALV